MANFKQLNIVALVDTNSTAFRHFLSDFFSQENGYYNIHEIKEDELWTRVGYSHRECKEIESEIQDIKEICAVQNTSLFQTTI